MLAKFRTEFFRPIDNSQIVLFRILFGLLMATESFGAIGTGWIKKVFIDPEHHFPFIWVDWLHPLPGDGMYYYFVVMGIASLMVAAGYQYRWSSLALALLWTGCYFMQKSSYNNHYYLAVLLCWFMALINPHQRKSLDSRLSGITRYDAPNWYRLFFIVQLFVMFSYAAVAKFSDSWISGDFITMKFASKGDYFLIGPLLIKPWFQAFVTYSGILFDALICPLLLWKRTRKMAFVGLISFNLFNSAVFQIGIFPYMVVALAIFFFDPKQIQTTFFATSPTLNTQSHQSNRWIMYCFVGYFLWQIYLPLRHHHIPGDVLWTEEGHRLSWRMMLRSRYGQGLFQVHDPDTGKNYSIRQRDYLSTKQRYSVSAFPDFAWQFAQILKADYQTKGIAHPEVYFIGSKVRINRGEYAPFIDPTVDLAQAKWNYWGHNEWILPKN
ncbi:HTTM domain-containing protein [Reichenbachiella sp. MSK19-1]|uniref:HTTM domain-containing protein n=1 Tax=Reichenbachiella sp. MSK19-1 TaxID=1897631 RepID=UPI000E6B857A|nr:HTTM domain-containing protein [Reichenbachiella sp. MSK19-1]RJE73032.1 hypothetical protein BGP76_03555 [Reichenbachiella sp. MSK19-1]